MGYIASKAAMDRRPLEVTIVGERRACRILDEPPVDPTGARMRA
jgi:glycine cleavage system aminomethyltransferase T